MPRPGPAPDAPPEPPDTGLAHLTDEQLMDRVALQDDGAALTELEWRWHERLHAYCRQQLHRHHLAEEAAQETWLRVWQYRTTWQADDPDRNFGAWLLAIANNVCHDKRGREGRWWPPLDWLRVLIERFLRGISFGWRLNTRPIAAVFIGVYHRRPDGRERADDKRDIIRLRYWADYHPDQSLRLTEEDLEPLSPEYALADDEHRRELNALFEKPPSGEPSAPVADYLCYGLMAPSLIEERVAGLCGVHTATVSRCCERYLNDAMIALRKEGYPI